MMSGSAEAVEPTASPIEQVALADGSLVRVDRDVLARLMEKRLHRFWSLVPKVMGGDGPEAVHDVGVWSRRLQQSLVALLSEPRRGNVRRVWRRLRRVQSAWAELGRCDVLLAVAA